MKIVAIIPARRNSTRLPNKPLITINNKPIIQHTYEGVLNYKKIEKIIVATDDSEIKKTVEGFGGIALMTSKNHLTGSDRICEVLKKIKPFDLILNIQGDEPLVNENLIHSLIAPFLEKNSKQKKVSTLIKKITHPKEIENPNIVKVVTSNDQKEALYFSRFPIPYNRRKTTNTTYYKHIGLYAYETNFLFKFNQHPQTPLEKSENLEQLRILEMKEKIFIRETTEETIDINTKEDLTRLKKYFQKD